VDIMNGKRSRGGGSSVVNTDDKVLDLALDPAFATLDTILGGPPAEFPQHPEDEIPNNGLLLRNLENGLSDQLVSAWANFGQVKFVFLWEYFVTLISVDVCHKFFIYQRDYSTRQTTSFNVTGRSI
jgi:hypothetical protein